MLGASLADKHAHPKEHVSRLLFFAVEAVVVERITLNLVQVSTQLLRLTHFTWLEKFEVLIFFAAAVIDRDQVVILTITYVYIFHVSGCLGHVAIGHGSGFILREVVLILGARLCRVRFFSGNTRHFSFYWFLIFNIVICLMNLIHFKFCNYNIYQQFIQWNASWR